MARIDLDLDKLTTEEQYTLIAEEMYRRTKQDVIEALKKALKESAGRGGDRVG